MPRTILVHLNVTVPGDDSRSIGEIAEAIEAALEVGADDPAVSGLGVHVALVDQIDG
jgi:hypothetical protein